MDVGVTPPPPSPTASFIIYADIVQFKKKKLGFINIQDIIKRESYFLKKIKYNE